MPPRVITLGEALVEIMRPEGGPSLDQEGIFKGPYASGAPAIFAVAAARLGMSTGFIGGVGKDAFGRLMRARLEAERVDISLMQEQADRASGAAFVAYTPDGNREFVFHIRFAAAGALDPGRLEPDYFSDIDWLHISGSTLEINENSRATCQRAMELTLASEGRVSFDPNLRPELMPVAEAREVFKPYLEACHLLLPTASEAYALTGLKNDEAAANLLIGSRDKVVVFKHGAKGCTIFSRSGRVEGPGFVVDVIDPTGAGDCFNAACVLGLSAGWPLEYVARFSNAAGALAVTRQGPMEGAPTRQEIEAFLAR